MLKENIGLLKLDVQKWNLWRRETNHAAIDLTGADLNGANLRGANLYGADLTWADLTWANLYGANLNGANLTWANLYGANLTGANLNEANLNGANLRVANLNGANLNGANLRGADLTGANLNEANLNGADLKRIRDDLYAILESTNEAEYLLKALESGQVDGSVYEGECACLVGTIAKAKQLPYDKIEGLKPNPSRPAERWFLAIKPVDTPQTNPISAITVAWVQAFIHGGEAQN